MATGRPHVWVGLKIPKYGTRPSTGGVNFDPHTIFCACSIQNTVQYPRWLRNTLGRFSHKKIFVLKTRIGAYA